MTKGLPPVGPTLHESIIKGFGFTIGYTFPVTFIAAIVYGIPLDGVHMSGLEVAIKGVLLLLLYGVMGVFVLLGAAGAVAGGLAHWAAGRDKRRANRLVHIYALITASIPFAMYIIRRALR